ncbi:DUF350 domain-containing protein [Bacillus megaterium]|nr:DUF350 domain-containing protein [Priestia megaterium NBRC 15308 = ATCC 14581]NGY87410.1 DUF350 domain-containing protein [Priestia megaterium]NGY92804.1 DUF350 domain-containing protein [Priestia megaterium]
MRDFWKDPYIESAAYYSVVVLSIVVFLVVFELVTKYKNWEEIQKEIWLLRWQQVGKIFGLANIFRYSIEHNDNLLRMLGWGIYGFVLLLVSYFIFEFLTPKFRIDDEIEQDNRAVGFISLVISIGMSYVIGAGIG